MPLSFLRLCFFTAVFASPLCAGWQWGVPEGGATLKALTIPLSPRTAALAGSGQASPQGGAEMFGNPLAPAAADYAVFGFNQVLLSNRIGASLSAVHYVQPWHSLRFAAGMQLLDYDPIEGRDEDGHPTGSYGAGMYAVQLGLASLSGPFTWGVTGRFASQNIAGYHSAALLTDAGLSFRINRHFRFAAAATNYGWVQPYDGYAETAPLAVQTGITSSYSFAGGFTASLHTDLYRRTDSDAQFLLGCELSYKGLLALRMGYPFRAGENAPSTGLALTVGPFSADYAYSARPALQGNHHFGLSLAF